MLRGMEKIKPLGGRITFERRILKYFPFFSPVKMYRSNFVNKIKLENCIGIKISHIVERY